MLAELKQKILPLRQQLTIQNEWLKKRLDVILPTIMERANLDMWLVIAREYNEDPIIMTLLPEPAMAARRRTILAFCRNGDGSVDRFTISRYGQKGFYEAIWKPEDEAQDECLARLIEERDPQRIGLNVSDLSAFGDGLSHTDHERLVAALPDAYGERLVSAENAAIGWLETRLPEEMLVYGSIVKIGHALIAEAFSSRVITPGITTTQDVVWWLRQTMQDLGLRAWFQPSIDLQAVDVPFRPFYTGEEPRSVIMPGDLLHCDVGFYYLGLATDQQQHAYVLRPGESDAPAGLKAALGEGNRLQDIHMEQMAIGRTGNEVLSATRHHALDEGLKPQVYSHPLGYHGHAAGPTIGLWDQQGGVPGKGEYPIYDNTAYSIELNVEKAIPEWDDQNIRIMLEEDAVLEAGKMRWLNGRQTRFHLI